MIIYQCADINNDLTGSHPTLTVNGFSWVNYDTVAHMYIYIWHTGIYIYILSDLEQIIQYLGKSKARPAVSLGLMKNHLSFFLSLSFFTMVIYHHHHHHHHHQYHSKVLHHIHLSHHSLSFSQVLLGFLLSSPGCLPVLQWLVSWVTNIATLWPWDLMELVVCCISPWRVIWCKEASAKMGSWWVEGVGNWL